MTPFIAAILVRVGLPKYLAPILLWLVIALAILTFYKFEAYRHYSRGWDDSLTAISATNQEAANQAEKLRNEGVYECFDKGGDWDGKAGRCID